MLLSPHLLRRQAAGVHLVLLDSCALRLLP